MAPALEAAAASARQGANAAFARVSSGSEFNRLGLTREMSVGAVAAVGVFLWAHSADLRNPAALVEAFDPAPVRTLFALGREQAQCQMEGIGGLIGQAEKPADCSGLYKMLAAHSGDDGLIGQDGEEHDGGARRHVLRRPPGPSPTLRRRWSSWPRSSAGAASAPRVTRWATAVCTR